MQVFQPHISNFPLPGYKAIKSNMNLAHVLMVELWPSRPQSIKDTTKCSLTTAAAEHLLMLLQTVLESH